MIHVTRWLVVTGRTLPCVPVTCWLWAHGSPRRPEEGSDCPCAWSLPPFCPRTLAGRALKLCLRLRRARSLGASSPWRVDCLATGSTLLVPRHFLVRPGLPSSLLGSGSACDAPRPVTAHQPASLPLQAAPGVRGCADPVLSHDLGVSASGRLRRLTPHVATGLSGFGTAIRHYLFLRLCIPAPPFPTPLDCSMFSIEWVFHCPFVSCF